MFYHFWSQENITAFQIGFIIFLKALLEVFPEYKLLSFINTKVTSEKIVIVAADLLILDDFWYQK